MLTGKNKENFNDFLRYDSGVWMYLEKGKTFTKYDDFNNLPLSMQWGIVQDYADSIGYEIGIKSSDTGFAVYFNDVCMQTQETRNEARKAAIKAFDEIVNG